MLEQCEAILSRSISAPSATRTTIASPAYDYDEDLTVASLLKDENLCAWNSDFLTEDRRSTKQTSKKYDVLKASVVGLHVKKSHFFVNNKHKTSKLNVHCKDQNTSNECSFVHYTDSRQYVEEYRKNKILRMKKEFDCEHEDGQIYNNNDTVSYENDTRKSYPIMCFQSYGNIQNNNLSYGYRLDSTIAKEKQKCSIKELPLEKKRLLVNCVKVRGGKCVDQHENDVQTSTTKHVPVANCKPISICNLFPYENISLPDSKGHVAKNREPMLQPESSLQCKKITDQYHPDARKVSGWKPPSVKGMHSAEEGRKVYKHAPPTGKSNEYCHIIKRVFGQYDHSKHPVRNKKDPDGNFSYILTPS